MKPNMLRMKVEFEEYPMLDISKKVSCPQDIDDMTNGLKVKLFGKRRP